MDMVDMVDSNGNKPGRRLDMDMVDMVDSNGHKPGRRLKRPNTLPLKSCGRENSKETTPSSSSSISSLANEHI